jgi:hypothetical protein
MAGAYVEKSISVDADVSAASRYQAKKEARIMAQKKAVSQYVTSITGTTERGKVNRLADEYSLFVVGMVVEKEFNFRGGHVSGLFNVTLDDEALNREMETMGLSAQGMRAILIILEEPPSRAKINLFASGQFGFSDFVGHYTDFQRVIRDTIIRKANEQGLKIQLLADMPEFSKFRSRDQTLLGVYYDPDLMEFEVHKDLIQAVKSRIPDGIAIYYRIDSLYLDPDGKTLHADISISVKDFATNETRAAGSRSFAANVPGRGLDAILSGFEFAMKNATALIMNPVKRTVNEVLMSRAPSDTTIRITCASIRTLYRFKREILKSDKVFDARVQSGTLTFGVRRGTAPEDFVFGYMDDMFKRLHLPVPAEKDIQIRGKTVQIHCHP